MAVRKRHTSQHAAPAVDEVGHAVDTISAGLRSGSEHRQLLRQSDDPERAVGGARARPDRAKGRSHRLRRHQRVLLHAGQPRRSDAAHTRRPRTLPSRTRGFTSRWSTPSPAGPSRCSRSPSDATSTGAAPIVPATPTHGAGQTTSGSSSCTPTRCSRPTPTTARRLTESSSATSPPTKQDQGRNLPGQRVFTCLSHDIIAHEVTHAVIDGIRTYFTEPTNPDVLAFHEGFADLCALFSHFSEEEALIDAIQRTGGRLYEAVLAPEAAPLARVRRHRRSSPARCRRSIP